MESTHMFITNQSRDPNGTNSNGLWFSIYWPNIFNGWKNLEDYNVWWPTFKQFNTEAYPFVQQD